MVDVLVEASRQAGQRRRRHDGQGMDLLEEVEGLISRGGEAASTGVAPIP